MFSFLQRKGKDLDRKGEEKSPASLKTSAFKSPADNQFHIGPCTCRQFCFHRRKCLPPVDSQQVVNPLLLCIGQARFANLNDSPSA